MPHMPPAVVASTSASGALLAPTDAFASLSIAGPSPNRSKFRVSWDGMGKKVKDSLPDIAVFTATMTGLPLIQDAVKGVQKLQDWKSCRDELDGFRQRLEQLLAAIETHSQDPACPVYRTPAMAEFRQKLESVHAHVQIECTRQSSLRYDNARRVLELDKEYKDQAVVIAGALRQQDVDPPEVYDEIIPTLRSVHKDNGLEYIATLRTYRYDGGPVEHAPVQNLHVTTHKGAYRGKLVEIKEYFGGPEGELLQNIQELVEHHQTFDDNANLARLYGGCVRRLPDGKLCPYLVFTPTKGEPWVEVAKAKLSVELLCQVDLFDYLKTKRQMNWDSIKIGPDGTLCMDLTTQGDNFLLTEQIWDPIKDHELVSWPIKELFELFQEADRQGITRDAIAALRAHTGSWDKIAVWKVAKQIGLRPAENSLSWRAMYPPRDWQIHAGMIVAWLGDEDVEEFDQLDMMPEQGLCWFNQKHLRQFLMLNAHGETGDRTLVSYRREENWFKCMPGGEWEYFPLEAWEDLEWISLSYESPRLDTVSWDQWKTILQSCSKRRNRDLHSLAVITRTEGWQTLHKRNCPELGTRPLYFYRKPDQASATPREFWGFFSFNPDPNGAPGINMRVNECGMGRLVSDSVLLQPLGWEDTANVDFEIVWVNMRDDWDYKIQSELERKMLNPPAMYEEEEITWPDDEDGFGC